MKEKVSFENNRLYAFGPFRLDAGERRLLRGEEQVSLTRKGFDLLLILVESAGRLKTREELIAALWPKNAVEEQGLTTKLYALRKALGDEGATAPRYIETVRGIGYRFIAPVTLETRAADAAAGTPRPKRRIRLATVIGALLVLAALAVAATYAVLSPRTPQAVTGIAVLPFENLSANKSDAYFATGIQDTILTRLAGIRGIRVISRSSVKSYPSHPQDLREIASELGVTTVLEGSVQHVGKRVLVNVQLINAKTDTLLWAATYTRTLDNVFEVEGDVARQVATVLSTRLAPGEIRRLARPSTSNPRAYVLFLKANYNGDRVFMRANAKDSVTTAHRAVALYRQALALDPKFALAYARLSLLESRIFWFNPDGLPNQDIGPPREDAKRALELDPDLPQAWVAMGYVTYYGEMNYPKALVQFRHAQRLLPNSAEIIGVIARIQSRQGNMKSALSGLQQAARLDPMNPHWRELLGTTLIALRRYDEAGWWLNQALVLEPHDYKALIRKANLALMTADAKQLERLAANIPPDAVPGLVPELRFQAAYLDRDPNRAFKVLDNAPVWLTSTNSVPTLPSSLFKAEAWALKGDRAQARRSYQLARDQAKTWLHTYPKDPAVNSALGMAEAGLGNSVAAIQAGRRSANYMPVSRDALLGVFNLTALAQIYGLLNEAKPAVKVLDRLLAMPAGRAISIPLLKASPLWDGIRKDPQFQALLKKYSPHGAAQTTP